MTVINSLADLPGATLQEIFDQVAQHLLSQKRRSAVLEDIDNNGDGEPIEFFRCVFADSTGARCAVGCLMDDTDIQTARTWGWGDPTDLPSWEELSTDQRALLSGLRNIHDVVATNDWKKELMNLATELGLSPLGVTR